MKNSEPSSSSGAQLLAGAIALVLIAGSAGWFAARYTGPSTAEREAIGEVVRDYILDNPEILPEAMERLQAREATKNLSGVRSEVETPYPGAVMGNPDGKVTLVEFSDFACGYCRRSVDDVKALVAKNPDLRIVMRELPILSPQSAAAARMALAAAEQGKYTAFHDAMFAAGRPNEETINAAAQAAGLDLAKAHAAIRSERIDAELNRNVELARQLGFGGTPSWIVGDELISGAVGVDRLAEAIVKSRG